MIQFRRAGRFVPFHHHRGRDHGNARNVELGSGSHISRRRSHVVFYFLAHVLVTNEVSPVLPSPGGEVSKNEFTLTIVDLYGWVDHVPAQYTLQQLVRVPLHEYDREISESLGQLGN